MTYVPFAQLPNLRSIRAVKAAAEARAFAARQNLEYLLEDARSVIRDATEDLAYVGVSAIETAGDDEDIDAVRDTLISSLVANETPPGEEDTTGEQRLALRVLINDIIVANENDDGAAFVAAAAVIAALDDGDDDRIPGE